MFKPSNRFLIAAIAPPLHQLLTCETCGCLCLMRNMLPLHGILIAFATKKNYSLSYVRLMVASAMSDLLPQRVASALSLVVSAMWYLCTFRYGILIASTMGSWLSLLRYWGRLDLCRLSWSPSLRGIFVASLPWLLWTFVISVGCLWYVGLISPQLVASAIWDHDCLYYVEFWSPQLVAAASCFCYVGRGRPR